MWRRHGDSLYALLVVVVFTLELGALAALVWVSSLRLGGLVPRSRLNVVLIGAVIATALALFGVTVYILGYHAVSAVLERRHTEALSSWTERWIQTLLYDADPPMPPLTLAAEESALALRDLLRGDDGLALTELLRSYSLDERLIDRMRGRRLAPRLDALDQLSRARFPTAFEPLVQTFVESDAVARLMAGRAIALTLADWPEGPERDRACATFTRALEEAPLPSGAASEVMQLLEGAAPQILRALLSSERQRPELLRAAADTVGRMGRTELRGQVGQWIAHPNPEVRSAALRALSRLGRVPLNLSEDLLTALDDQTEFVRVQAAHAAKGLPQKLVLPILYESMGDRSWWVRRASAESLLRLGAGGRATLEKAARSHPDRFARDMSAQVLADSHTAVEDRRRPLRAQPMEVPA